MRFRYGPACPTRSPTSPSTSPPARPWPWSATRARASPPAPACSCACGTWTPGSITIGGHDIRDFPQDDLRRLITLVPQDVYLFNIPLLENIRLGRPEATRDEVIAAARAAQADEFIRGLPDGYDTLPGELGARLSGGQRQRIAIARAILKDAPILIMDEAVSNLDTESEQEVAAAMAAAAATAPR